MRPPRGGVGLRSWAVPSLMVGAVATLVDVGVLLASIRWLHVPTFGAAMLGVAVGSTVAFLGNRRFAFRSSARAWAPEALRLERGLISVRELPEGTTLLRDVVRAERLERAPELGHRELFARGLTDVTLPLRAEAPA